MGKQTGAMVKAFAFSIVLMLAFYGLQTIFNDLRDYADDWAAPPAAEAPPEPPPLSPRQVLAANAELLEICGDLVDADVLNAQSHLISEWSVKIADPDGSGVK